MVVDVVVVFNFETLGIMVSWFRLPARLNLRFVRGTAIPTTTVTQSNFDSHERPEDCTFRVGFPDSAAFWSNPKLYPPKKKNVNPQP